MVATTQERRHDAEDASDCAHDVDIESHAIGSGVADAIAVTLKALADPLRLRMLSAIASAPSGESCVCDLASLTHVSQPTVSHHLKVLRDVGVLISERRGTWVWYRVAPGYRGAVTSLLDRFVPAALDSYLGTAPESHELTGLVDVEPVLERLAKSLADRFPRATRHEVLQLVRESYAALARRGGSPVHLVALTERFARQRILDRLRASDTAATRRPQVLFVCVANAGRSQLAAALLKHYAGDKIEVRSAGSAPAADIHATVHELLHELHDPDAAEEPDVAYPKPLTDDAVRAADVVITMGCGDTCPVLPGKRYEEWVVGDPALASPAGVRAIRDELDVRVRALVTELIPT